MTGWSGPRASRAMRAASASMVRGRCIGPRGMSANASEHCGRECVRVPVAEFH